MSFCPKESQQELYADVGYIWDYWKTYWNTILHLSRPTYCSSSITLCIKKQRLKLEFQGWLLTVWDSDVILHLESKRNPLQGAHGYGDCEASRPAVLQMSWAAHYQVYVTWDYPRWHPLKANSQQCSWGGIWWRVCVCVYMCVHSFRLVVTFDRMGICWDICCVIRYCIPSHWMRNVTQVAPHRDERMCLWMSVIMMAAMLEDR